MNIETYGTGERLRHAAALCAKSIRDKHLVLLPVPTTKDKKTVKNTDILLSDTLCNVCSGSLVVGYALPSEFTENASKLGAEVLDLESDEEYLCENAYLTAVGALGYILNNSTRIPRDTVIGVIGYGRIGSRLAELLLYLGATVKVFTSKPLRRLELGECGIRSCSISEINDSSAFCGIDILINTAPKDMSDLFHSGIPSGLRIIELASGDNFRGVEGVTPLPALPERMFAESAGRTYFESVKRYLSEVKE